MLLLSLSFLNGQCHCTALFPFISSVSRGGGEQFLSPVWWWNGTRRAGDHRSCGDWDFGLCAGMGRLGMMPGKAAGAHGAEGALAGSGAVPGCWWGREGQLWRVGGGCNPWAPREGVSVM